MSHTSLFHAEVFRFLQKEAEKRAAEEGFFLEQDLELQQFQRALAEGSRPLTDILRQYRDLFDGRGPIHLEQRLLEKFGTLKIYRALPRLYLRMRPSQSRIKPNFTHFPSLAKLVAEKSMCKLYPTPQKGKIALLTWVIADGWGDYFAAKEVVQLLRQHFEIHWIVVASKKTSLPLDDARAIRTHFPLRKDVLEQLRAHDLVLQFPTYAPKTPQIAQSVGPIHSIGEYGFVESSWFHPRSQNRSMGLHFLEKGILFPRPFRASWEELENRELLRWMKQPAGRFYLAYLATASGAIVYLHALFKSLEQDPQDIDLCMPDLRWLAEQPVLQHPFGIQRIDIYFGKNTYTLPVAGKGKRVRIFVPKQLSHSDFQRLLALSDPFVAVRGNQSLSEALALGKTFFYDGKAHSRYFLKDLLALAENRLKAYPNTLVCLRGIVKASLHNLPLEESEWVDDTYFQEKEPLIDIALEIGGALQGSDTSPGFKRLSAILQEEHRFEEFLLPFINREFVHATHPKIAPQEQKHLDHFIRGDCSFSELLLSIQKFLNYNNL